MAKHNRDFGLCHNFVSALLPLLACVSCSQPKVEQRPQGKPVITAYLTISMPALETTMPIVLDQQSPSAHGSQSFSSDVVSGRDYKSSVSHCFVGKLDFADPYDLDAGIAGGDVVAIRVALYDAKTNDKIFSKTTYAVYDGKAVMAYDEKSIQVTIHPKRSEPDG